MSDQDLRVARLRAAAAEKSERATAAARRAIVSLENRGRPINFNTVAEEGGVSKSFLYASSDLRRLIADKRRLPSGIVAPSPRASQQNERGVTQKLAAATEALRRLRTENEVLRAENALLRGDLANKRRH